jgi:hypothetical protein
MAWQCFSQLNPFPAFWRHEIKLDAVDTHSKTSFGLALLALLAMEN